MQTQNRKLTQHARHSGKKSDRRRRKTVGHIPRRLSAICSLFIRQGGAINCRVNGHRRYPADLPQGGLEIPRILTFVVNNHKEDKKAQQLLGDTVSVEAC